MWTLSMLVTLMAFLAFVVDLGYLQFIDTQLQRTADSSAVAAARALAEEQSAPGQEAPTSFPNTVVVARQFAALNKVALESPALADQDVAIGQFPYPSTPDSVMTFSSPAQYNAVTVNVRRTTQQNGAIPLYFARVLGMNQAEMHADATAMFAGAVRGFRTPPEGVNLPILPIAIKKSLWDALIASGTSDRFRYDPDQKAVVPGAPDGIPELSLFPQDTGSAGNYGTINIGSDGNSTQRLGTQIEQGISASDLASLAETGRSMDLDSTTGTTSLNADTGISAGVKASLEKIIGKTRIIPVYSSFSGTGNTAECTICQYVGVRIVYVNFQGSNKKLVIQPAVVVVPGGKAGVNASSPGVNTSAWIVR
jgi:hypothetical protein